MSHAILGTCLYQTIIDCLTIIPMNQTPVFHLATLFATNFEQLFSVISISPQDYRSVSEPSSEPLITASWQLCLRKAVQMLLLLREIVFHF